jgi:hypothetical protein
VLNNVLTKGDTSAILGLDFLVMKVFINFKNITSSGYNILKHFRPLHSEMHTTYKRKKQGI